VKRDELLDRLDLRSYTPHTIVDPAALRRALDEARERGFTIDDEEYDDGVRCVAVPVGGTTDGPAAISVSAPASRMSRQRCLELVPLLRRSAADLVSGLRERGDTSA
jgi:DNA-binding IclR family transcriptional regulator